MVTEQERQEAEESESLNGENSGVGVAVRKSRFLSSRSKSADHPVGGGGVQNAAAGHKSKPRRLSNQLSMEMSRRLQCSEEELDVVDDAGALRRGDDLEDIQVHLTNSRSFGLSSSFLRRKKDEYEGD